MHNVASCRVFFFSLSAPHGAARVECYVSVSSSVERGRSVDRRRRISVGNRSRAVHTVSSVSRSVSFPRPFLLARGNLS
jgi:hypothetical protein